MMEELRYEVRSASRGLNQRLDKLLIRHRIIESTGTKEQQMEESCDTKAPDPPDPVMLEMIRIVGESNLMANVVFSTVGASNPSAQDLRAVMKTFSVNPAENLVSITTTMEKVIEPDGVMVGLHREDCGGKQIWVVATYFLTWIECWYRIRDLALPITIDGEMGILITFYLTFITWAYFVRAACGLLIDIRTGSYGSWQGRFLAFIHVPPTTGVHARAYSSSSMITSLATTLRTSFEGSLIGALIKEKTSCILETELLVEFSTELEEIFCLRSLHCKPLIAWSNRFNVHFHHHLGLKALDPTDLAALELFPITGDLDPIATEGVLIVGDTYLMAFKAIWFIGDPNLVKIQSIDLVSKVKLKIRKVALQIKEVILQHPDPPNLKLFMVLSTSSKSILSYVLVANASDPPDLGILQPARHREFWAASFIETKPGLEIPSSFIIDTEIGIAPSQKALSVHVAPRNRHARDTSSDSITSSQKALLGEFPFDRWR
ncbi:hypothetical protein Syun_020836 [Stephania yunnanensis]|uniref:Uncharacterized protein n=1 Tax=Stephania yunnanensis TaxID=152371 RepID=A0AAP0NQ27_9MAGN